MNSKRWRVLRVNISEYQANEFTKLEKELLEKIPDVTYVNDWNENPNLLITNSQTEIADLPQDGLDNIELIVHPNSGYDKFSAHFLGEFKRPVVVGNPIRAQAVAQYILACLFDRFTCPPFDGKWDNERSWHHPLIGSLQIQLIGHGHIGKILSPVLKALGAKLHIHDPWQGMDDLVPEECDVVIPVCGLNPSSQKIIDGNFLAKLKKDVTIINAARGGLVDQKELIEFLFENQRACAYLDVFEKEPFSSADFSRLSNVALTSHVAGVHENLDQSILNFENEVISTFIHDRDLFNTKYSDVLLENRIRDDVLI